MLEIFVAAIQNAPEKDARFSHVILGMVDAERDPECKEIILQAAKKSLISGIA